MIIFRTLQRYGLVLIVITIMCVLALLANYITAANTMFARTFLTYAASADDADTAAYILTAANNPIRQELNLTLVQVLQDSITDLERLRKAQHGLELVNSARQQIDDLAPLLEGEATAVFEMEKNMDSAHSVFQRALPQKIVALAKERLSATKDIQSLSYRANFETMKIFEHITSTEGALSSEYLNELNTVLPATEEEFLERQNRYRTLQITFDQIQSAYTEFDRLRTGRQK